MSEKSLADKMFVKKASRIAVLNAKNRAPRLLAALPEALLVGGSEAADFVLMFASSQQELEDVLPLAKMRLAPKGALWVAYIKGTSRNASDVHRDTIRSFAATLGLTAVSLIAVDDDWSALRLKHRE